MTAPDGRFAPIRFTTRFPALDGLRALAILLVFADHFGGGAHGGRVLQVLNAIRERGWVGVDLFFVLSGFLITGILFDTQNDSHYFQRFFARRSLRILPAFYLVAAVLLALTPLFHFHWRWEHATFLVFLGNFFANRDGWLYDVVSTAHPNAGVQIGHLWTLCLEEQFYWIWPVIVVVVRDRVRLLRVALVLSAIALLLRIPMVLLLDGPNAEWWIVRTLPFRMDALLLGAALALLLRGPRADMWQRRAKWSLLISLLLLAVLIALWPAYDAPALLTVGLTLTAIASASLICVVLRAGSVAQRLFSLRPLRSLGRVSYGFYLFHLLFSYAWIALLVRLEHDLGSRALAGVLELGAAFLVTLAAAWLSYTLLERPILRLKRRFPYDIEQAAHQHAFRP